MANLFIRILTSFSGQGFAEGEKGAKQFKGELDSLKRELGLGISLGIVVNEIKDFVVGSVMAAEQGEAVERAFTNLSGGVKQAAENMEAMQDATRGLISETQQQQIANQLLGMNLVTTAGELEKTVEVSRRLGKEFRGIGAAEAANEFALMISNMSVARLDTFGISSGAVRTRIDELMASAKGMTREQAFFQAVMEEADKTLERLGPEIKTTSDRVAELGARWADFQEATGQLITGEQVGFWDAVVETATVFVEKLTDGAEAWQGIFDRVGAIADSINLNLIPASENYLGIITRITNQWFPQLGLLNMLADTIGASAAEAGQRISEETQETGEQAKEQVKEIEQETGDDLLGLKHEFARETLDIQKETDDQLADEVKSFAKETENLEEDHAETIADIRKQSAKSLSKIQSDLQKDLAKEDKDLKKELAKLEQDQGKRVAEFQEKAGKEEKQQRKLERIDALADARLFQFELGQLAAEGEGNAIKAALERRAIEEEIAKEKAGVEQEIEEDKREETLQSMRGEGEERRAQLQADAQERQAILQERNQEEVAGLNERLAEEIAAENESFSERKTDLKEHYDERVAEIREGEAKAVAEIAQALTETEGITTEKLAQLTPIARAIGEDTGEQFAAGIIEGYRKNQDIEQLLSGAKKGGIQPVSAEQRAAIGQLSGGIATFQNEGFVTGSVGIAHRGEVVLNPAGGSLGGGTIQIGNETFITSHAARLAAVINAQRQKDMQSLVDSLAGLMD